MLASPYRFLFKTYAIFFAFLFCMLFFPHKGQAQTLNIPFNNIMGGTWSLSADSLSTLDNGAIIEAQGNVILERDNTFLRADLIRYYTATQWVFVKGNVELKTGEDYLLASQAEIDLSNFTGFLHDGEVIMQGQHVYMTGEYVEKHLGNVYSFEKATVTTCDPDDPLWKLSAGGAVIDIDGQAKLHSVKGTLAGISTLPIPRMTISLVERRQTGFLMPRFSNSSEYGFSYTQPFFLVIDEGRDLTVAGTYYTKNDIRTSVKYRAYPELDTKVWVAGDYLFKADAQDDRYWLRGMAEGNFFDSEWNYRVDLDYASDDEYLLDYRTSYLGHQQTAEETFEFFGRELAPIQDDRKSVGYIYRTWNNIYFTTGFEIYQNPDYGSILPRSADPTVQVLPEISTYLFPIQPFENVPMQLDSSLSFARNYRREGTSGFSGIFDPRLSTPINLKFLSVLPQIRLIQRNYITEDNTITSAPLESASLKENSDSDTTFDVQVQTMMQASKVWEYNEKPYELIPENVGKSRTLALQHRIEPRLTYIYAPDKDQTHLPFYSQEDRIFSQNEFQFSLHNIFTAKKEDIIQVQNQNNEILLEKVEYYDTLARLTFGAAFDIEESGRTTLVEKYRKKPFRDLTLDAQVYALGLNLTTHLSVSLYDEGITKFDLSADIPLFALEKYLSWNTEVSYRNTTEDYYNIIRYDASESVLLNEKVTLLKNSLAITPIEALKLSIEHYINLQDTSTYTITSGIDFYHECLHFGLEYIYSVQDQAINFRFTIPNLFE